MKGSGGNEAALERPNRVLSSYHVTETKQGWVLPRTRLPHGYHGGAKDYRGNLSSKKRILESK